MFYIALMKKDGTIISGAVKKMWVLSDTETLYYWGQVQDAELFFTRKDAQKILTSKYMLPKRAPRDGHRSVIIERMK